MTTLEHSKSRRLYSWWWDSHISPKNSKWLQENLTDMDSKVKTMIKLIEEDADSFARRAEMYYKKRPELTKLVEEFYRAYRALAERYDHATGELRQAHHTMAKAFPNQISHVLTDDSPCGSYVPEVEPRTPEMPSPIRSFYYPDDTDKDVLGVSPYPHVIKRNWAYSAENSTPSRKGLKQLNEICQTGEGEEAYTNSHDGRARKGLYFPEEEGKGSGHKKLDFSRDFHSQDLSRKEDVQSEIKCLREALALLSTENQNLKSQKASESERADKAESDVRNLKDSLSKLNSEKEDVTHEYHQSIERISSMETELSRTQDEFEKLNDVTITEAMKFSSAENRCVLLDKANQSLRLDMDDQEQKMKNLQEENSKLWTENRNLTTQVTSESKRADKAESEVQSVKDSLSKLNFETEAAVLQYQHSLERISCLEGQFSRKQDDFTKLSGEMVMQATKLNSAEDQCLVLEKEKQSLKLELEQKMKAQQEDYNQLSTENENLKTLITKELDHAQKAEIEVQSLKSQVSELNYEKEAVNVQYQLSVEMISHLETQISQTQDDYTKLSGEMVMQATKLNSAEDQCLVLEKEIRSLRLELDILEQKMKAQQEDNNQLSAENESLKSLITKELDHAHKAEIEVQRVKSQVSELNLEKEAANVQYQQSLEMISHLETQVSQTQDDNIKLMDEMVREATKLSNAEQQCLLLNKANQTLKTELDTLEEKVRDSQEEISQLSAVVDNLKIQITSESKRAYKAATEVQSLKEKVRDSQEEISQLSAVIDNLKIQITSESGRAYKAETEVQSLKDTLSNLSFENESCLHQYQLSLEKISYLETQIYQAEENIKKLSDDMVLETMKLRLAEEQCLVLEKANQSKILELDTLGKGKKAAEEEVSYHRLELEKINTSLQDEHQQLIGAQLALLTMEKLHSKSQEELKHLDLEIQCAVDKLKDAELRNMGLQEEMCNIKDENSSLLKHNLSSAMQIKVLEDEINILREVKGKFEDEMVVYLEEKKLLQHNFDYLKDEKNELEQRHQYLSAEMDVVRLNAESLDVSIKQLQDEHTELNDICKTHEEEKLLLLENLKNMDNISEKNRDMENSLANANVELHKLRAMINALEHSCEALHGEVSTHITEKSVLFSQVETIAQSMEKLMEENTFLEKSSSVVKLEAEGLRRKLKDLEDSFQALYDQKENLIVERSTLILQVDSMSQSLERVENRHAELEIKHLNLEKENALRVHEILELESLLKLEKQGHDTLIQSSKNQLSTLENEILVLREENQVREEEVEVEHKIVVGSEIELLVLHSSIRDMNEVILSLSKDCQKHSEASRCAEKLVSRLKEEDIVQMEKMSLLLAHNEKVKERILLLSTALNINKHCGAVDGEKDEVLLEIILGEIEKLLNSVSAVWDEVHRLQLEISVIVTLLDQTGLHLKDMTIEKQLLEQELEIRKDEVSVLQCNKQELLERNEQLMQDMQISGHREEEMKFAMGALQWHLSDLQDAQRASQSEIHKILDKNQSLSRTIHSLRETKEALEEENSVVIAEALTLDHLYLLFRSFSSERAFDLKLWSDDAYRLSDANNNLDQEIRQMNEKMGVLEMENIHLKESVACMEEYRNCLVALQFDLQTSHCYCKELSDQVENGNDLLLQKERELSETNEKVQSTKEKNEELSRNLECLNEEIYKAKMVREELQNKNFSLSEDIAYRNKEIERIGEVNKLLYDKLEILNSEVGALRSRGEQLASSLLKGIAEIHRCELEIMKLLKETQFSAVSAAIFEDKVFELILESEISTILQREVLNEEIHSRNTNAKDLKEKLDHLEGENRGLRAYLDAYLPLVTSLWGSIASLEEQTLSLTRHPASFNQESEENFLGSHQKLDNNSLGEHPTPMVPTGVLELQKSMAKFGELQKVITDTAALLEKERLDHNADLEAARKEIREIKAQRSSSHEEIRTENDVERGADHKLHQDDCEHSKRKHVQMMKDIQLDQVSSTPYGLNRFEITETDDQMLKLWESAESGCDGQMKRAPQAVLEPDIEAVEEGKSEYPSSELVPEKELSVDRLEVSSGVGQSHQEWSRRVIERLSSDSQRLSVLQMSMQELERKMETYEMSNPPKSVEYDTIKAKLKEAQGAVLQLININSKLTKKAEDFPASCDGTSGAQEETERKGRMQISARAQRGSEKIGRLELELQKIQFILLKLEEEHNSEKGKPTDRKPKTILSDYIHGRRNGDKQKKKSFCGCMRPKTDSD